MASTALEAGAIGVTYEDSKVDLIRRSVPQPNVPGHREVVVVDSAHRRSLSCFLGMRSVVSRLFRSRLQETGRRVGNDLLAPLIADAVPELYDAVPGVAIAPPSFFCRDRGPDRVSGARRCRQARLIETEEGSSACMWPVWMYRPSA